MIPNDPERIADNKVSVVKRCILESMNDPQFQMYVKKAFEGAKPKTIIRLLWNYQNKFLFIPEHKSKDYCQHALEFAKRGQGDCEDFVVYNGSILKQFSIRYRIKVMDTKGAGYYTHILLEVFDPVKRRWISFDGTYRREGLGGQPRHTKVRVYGEM